MNVNVLIALDDSVDCLEHTFRCSCDMSEGKPCNCGLQEIREAIVSYRDNVWKEVNGKR